MIRAFRIACVTFAVLAAAGCANARQSALPSIPSQTGALAVDSAGAQPAAIDDRKRVGFRVTVHVPHDGGADFTAAFPRSLPKNARKVRAQLKPGAKVWVYADLYPSYADYRKTYWGGVLTIAKDGTVSIPFGKVVPANNEWLIVTFDKYQSNGLPGDLYLGSEAAVLNVGKGNFSGTATPASTLVFQAVMGMANAGFLAAADFKNPKLTKTISLELKSSGIKADPSTGLYSQPELFKFADGVRSRWQRMLTLNGGSGAKLLSVANDTSDLADTYAYYNQYSYLNSNLYYYFRPLVGSPCYGGSNEHLPTKKVPLLPAACATLFGSGTGSVTVPVFGGSLVVGASNDALPFTGASKKIPERAKGTKSTVTLTQVPTQVTIKTSDPQDWAFGARPALYTNLYSKSIDASLSSYASGYYYYFFGYSQVYVPSSYSMGSPTIDVNSWNPWGLPLSNFALCAYYNFHCTPFPIAGTFNVWEPFNDNGTNGTYYNWQGKSGTVVSYNAVCHGYVLTPSGGSITMTTTVPSYLTDQQYMYVSFGTCGSAAPPASGSTVTMTATDALGHIYSGKAAYNNYFYMNTSADITPITSLTITVKLGSGSPPQIFAGAIY